MKNKLRVSPGHRGLTFRRSLSDEFPKCPAGVHLKLALAEQPQIVAPDSIWVIEDREMQLAQGG